MVAPENEGRRLKVLLVDDDLALRGVTTTHLRKAGYDVEIAVNGKEGLEKAIANPPDVLVSDIMMPVMDGVELLKHVREEESVREAYVILLTAKDSTVDMLAGFDASADDYLTKPFKMAELVARVKAGGRLKWAQDELRETNIKLREALRQRAELLGIAVHDLRNPISIITTYISLLGQSVVSDETIREVCLRRAKGLNGLIHSLLDMSKIDAGLVEIQSEAVDFSLLLRETEALYEPVARQRGVCFQLDCPEPVRGTADRNRVIEIFNTLFDVALQLTPQDGTVSAGLSRKGGELTLSVTSSGGGLPPEKIALVFSPESHLDVLQGYDAGMLVGLAIVKKLVALLNGLVFAESSGEKKGVTFGFTLPCHES